MKWLNLILLPLLGLGYASFALADTMSWTLMNKSNQPISVVYSSATGDPKGFQFTCNPPENTPKTVNIQSGKSTLITMDDTTSRELCLALTSAPDATPGYWGADNILYYPNKGCDPSVLACPADPCPGETTCTDSKK